MFNTVSAALHMFVYNRRITWGSVQPHQLQTESLQEKVSGCKCVQGVFAGQCEVMVCGVKSLCVQ